MCSWSQHTGRHSDEQHGLHSLCTATRGFWGNINCEVLRVSSTADFVQQSDITVVTPLLDHVLI